MIAFALIGLIGYASYSAYKLKDQIWCSFRRRDRTKIEKFASQRQAKIDFDNGWYWVRPERTTLILWTKGIHQIIPIWVRSLDYRWDSSLPLDPQDFTNKWDSPEARKALDKTLDIQALQAGNTQALSGAKVKKSLLEAYMPIIVIIGFIGLGYLMWNQQEILGRGQNAIQGMLGQIQSMLPK